MEYEGGIQVDQLVHHGPQVINSKMNNYTRCRETWTVGKDELAKVVNLPPVYITFHTAQADNNNRFP